MEGVTFNLLLNLASVCHAEDRAVLWHFIEPLSPGRQPPMHAPMLDRLVDYAVAYYRDFVRPTKKLSPARAGRGRARCADAGP